MASITKILHSNKGSIHIILKAEECLMMVKPAGFITPDLIKLELEEARMFGQKLSKPWTYCVDTTNVTFAHPLNIFSLRRIPKLPYIDKYYIIAPSLVLRILQVLLYPLIKTDKVFKSSKELDLFLDIR